MNFRITVCTAIIFIVSFVSFSALAQLPDNWDTDICDGGYYGDGECDCGCGGFDDLDCLSLSAHDCAYYMCDDGEYPAYFNNAVCLAVGMDTDLPADWLCPSFIYDDDLGCDCGCGALDGDCEDETVHACDFNECYDETDTSADPWYPGYNDNSQCYAPGDDPDISGWICLPEWWRDGFCDCGCGIVDYDCDIATVASCEEIFCDSDETVINSDIATCVPIGTIDTETDLPPDTDTPADTGIDTIDTMDTETETETETESDTFQISDTGSESDTTAEPATDDADTDTGTADSETVTDTGTVGDIADTATSDTETDPKNDSASDDTTSSIVDHSTDTVPVVDTQDNESIDTTVGSDSATLSETGANATITGRPEETKSAQSKDGSLFGCTMSPDATTVSLLQLFF